VYIGRSDYRNILHVTWYLTCEPGFFKKTVSSFFAKAASEKALSFILNVLQQQDLAPYATPIITVCLNRLRDSRQDLVKTR
jgi:hypothetical protein